MTLPYATCAALRAAGFNQQYTDIVYLPERLLDPAQTNTPMVRYAACHQNSLVLNDPSLLACPNSDELIAAIQARWPDECFQIFVGKITLNNCDWEPSCCINWKGIIFRPATPGDIADCAAQLWLAFAEAVR